MAAEITGVEAGLAVWGPEVLQRPDCSLQQAHAYCLDLAKNHYENFPLLLWMCPHRLRRPLAAVYAWCRWADDLADEIGNCQRSLELLDWWREELDACFTGDPTHPVTLALQQTVGDFRLDRQPFDHLLEAFSTDQSVHRYDTFDQLLGYCRNSANPVGRIVLRLAGDHDDSAVACSDAICTGLQLANFLQDVRRDHDAGRVYLPREDLERFGYDETSLASQVTTDGFLELMRFEVERAREILEGGRRLPTLLPGFRMPMVVDLFARGGAKILDRIEAVGFRVWEQRPVVRRRDVASMVLRALVAGLTRTVSPGRGGRSR
ncbi:MAG TPA: squalene synthase HpnC [Planctomycetaceae bacterium]|nr:squalene synthase HpnC [Planctomycetaceae bacterium]